jgi:EAL domain-containing protein (putative c-di-GMP-specific phosphodiesterase class I)
MPSMPGSVFLTAVHDEFPDIERIMLTGQASIDAAIAAINDARIFRFLTKPCPTGTLVTAIEDALASRTAAAAPDPKLVGDFEAALDGAVMAYQPIYSVREGRIFAYEALLRPQHLVLGSPGELIDAAIALGRQTDLDRRVRTLVASDIAASDHRAAVFVNLLPESLDDLVAALDSDPLVAHAHRVVLEITERASLDAIDELDEKLAALRGRGFRLALDDLGAGYAGLTALATLSPDIVKLDMELVRDCDTDRTRSTLVTSIVAICRELGMLSVAEGIETEAEYAHLTALGCDLFQGYAIAKPAEPFVEL